MTWPHAEGGALRFLRLELTHAGSVLPRSGAASAVRRELDERRPIGTVDRDRLGPGAYERAAGTVREGDPGASEDRLHDRHRLG